MIDDKKDATAIETEPRLPLLPARFDESASANARPVEPIPESRLSVLIRRLNSLSGASNARVLVLIVILGLATGALGGMALVKRNQHADTPPPANETVTELSGTAVENEVASGTAMGGTNFQSPAATVTRNRRSLSRSRTGAAPRAYRVAVIR